jgi:uncharacterized membrane protein YeaQ/YmgE (transglycosylase-associated protein family)
MELTIGYIIVGILAGYIASRITSGEGKGCCMDLFIGVIGGVVGGWVLNLLGITWGGPFSNIGTSVLGAVLVLWLWNKIK